MTVPTLYLGTYPPGWLEHLELPLIVSHRRLTTPEVPR